MYYEHFYKSRVYFNILARHAGTYKMPYYKLKQFTIIDNKYKKYPSITLIDLYHIFDTRKYLDEYHQNKSDIENYKHTIDELFDKVYNDLNHLDQLDMI